MMLLFIWLFLFRNHRPLKSMHSAQLLHFFQDWQGMKTFGRSLSDIFLLFSHLPVSPASFWHTHKGYVKNMKLDAFLAVSNEAQNLNTLTVLGKLRVFCDLYLQAQNNQMSTSGIFITTWTLYDACEFTSFNCHIFFSASIPKPVGAFVTCQLY